MSSKTKIVVLHMKELIYTGIFVALGILFVFLLVIMFLPNSNAEKKSSGTSQTNETTESSDETNVDTTSSSSLYIPGVYTTELVLNDQTINIEVIVDREGIASIDMINLNDAITTMYPLLESTFDDLVSQIYEKQSLTDITYKQESKYTSLVLLEAIKKSLEKAQQ